MYLSRKMFDINPHLQRLHAHRILEFNRKKPSSPKSISPTETANPVQNRFVERKRFAPSPIDLVVVVVIIIHHPFVKRKQLNIQILLQKAYRTSCIARSEHSIYITQLNKSQ